MSTGDRIRPILRYFPRRNRRSEIMKTTRSRRHLLAAFCAALTLAAAGATAVDTGVAGAASGSHRAPIVATENGVVRGVAGPDGYAFRGLPYAAPPTGDLRWRPPRPPADWSGVRYATDFAPNCPQPPSPITIGVTNEDCLYLNVSTPQLGTSGRDGLPVLVWIHGGGLRTGAGRDYDPTKLAADGVVVVTINYRLGALGFLAHPALASSPGGSTGNYGLMDQQAALRWVQSNIARFGGDPRNVTIAGESAGGLAVLAQLVSRGARGLFQRAIVQSGSFALTQQSLASAEAAGEAFATSAGCPDQTAACLRHLSVADIVKNFPSDAIPGVVDGEVLTESIGTALAAGRFARVPILNGTNHDEERIFVALGFTVSGGTDVLIPELPVTAENYQRDIASVLSVSDARAAAIAAEYPLDAYATPTVAFSTLVADANFACPALQMDEWTAGLVPTFAYEFNDDAAPLPVPLPLDPPVATHTAELAYLFDLPGATFSGPFSPDQEELKTSMRAAWANFAASGDPSTAAVPWPSVAGGAHVMSLVPPQPQVETDFASRHHCSFWAAG
jgi:para-nitrobenzyl esterase